MNQTRLEQPPPPFCSVVAGAAVEVALDLRSTSGFSSAAIAFKILNSPLFLPSLTAAAVCFGTRVVVKVAVQYNICEFNSSEDSKPYFLEQYKLLQTIAFVITMIVCYYFPIAGMTAAIALGAACGIDAEIRRENEERFVKSKQLRI